MRNWSLGQPHSIVMEYRHSQSQRVSFPTNTPPHWPSRQITWGPTGASPLAHNTTNQLSDRTHHTRNNRGLTLAFSGTFSKHHKTNGKGQTWQWLITALTLRVVLRADFKKTEETGIAFKNVLVLMWKACFLMKSFGGITVIILYFNKLLHTKPLSKRAVPLHRK